jgi:hypothetical protein
MPKPAKISIQEASIQSYFSMFSITANKKLYSEMEILCPKIPLNSK